MASCNETCNKLDIFKHSVRVLERALTNTSCHYAMHLPYKERCDFVMNNEDCGADGALLLNTFSWVFCKYSEEYSYFGMIWTAISLVLLFITTAFVADGYICPNLAVISKSLNLPDSIAGVTILALGNGVPDLFTAFAGAELDHPEILFAGVTGSALFDVSIAAGCVIFIRPFYIDTYCWWNLLFLGCNYSILFCGFYYRNLTIWHSISILIVYAIYAMFTIAHVAFLHRDTGDGDLEEEEGTLMEMARKRTIHIPELKYSRGTLLGTVELLKAYERTRIFRVMGYRQSAKRSADFGYSWRRPKELFLDLLDNLDIRNKYEWREGSIIYKVLLILQVPWIIGLKIFIPAVTPELKHNDGWCKLLFMINLMIYPFLILFCFDLIHLEIGGCPIWLLGLIICVFSAVLVFFHTRTNKKPRYHTAVAYLGFFGAIAVSRFLCAEVIVHLQTIGARFSLSSSWLALTVLSWGNSITDFVSALSLSKQGMQNMGFSSLFGSPMFNCSIGITIVSIIVYFEGKPLKAYYGSMSPVGSVFLFIVIIATIVLLPLTSFEGRRAVGFYLVLLYCNFFLLAVLMETIIHPFGTQYVKAMK